MSGFTENRASGASEHPGSPERILTWQASRAMLPLAARIAHDLAPRYERLGQLRPELALLEKNRLALDWPQRRRRYLIEEELAALDAEVRCLLAELDALGVALLEGDSGLIGFPTRVNDQDAFFSWMPGESELEYWNYAGDYNRRPVPEDWTMPLMPRARARKTRK